MSGILFQTPIHPLAAAAGATFVELLGWQVAAQFGDAAGETAALRQAAGLADQSQRGRVYVEGQAAGALLGAADLPLHAGRHAPAGRVYRLRPDRFFVASITTNASAALAEQAGTAGELITVTDAGHGTAELWLVGPRAGAVLARLCGVDFHDSQFPDGAARQSSVAKTTQLIIRQNLGGVPAYALIGARSLAAYLWQTILAAGADLGVRAVGHAAIAALLPDAERAQLAGS